MNEEGKFAGKIIDLLLEDLTLHTATKYLLPRKVIRGTVVCTKTEKKMGKRDKKSYRTDIVLVVGSPNYLERKFIKQCLKAGEDFPVKKIQLKHLKKKK